jgi:hypothetical protein
MEVLSEEHQTAFPNGSNESIFAAVSLENSHPDIIPLVQVHNALAVVDEVVDTPFYDRLKVRLDSSPPMLKIIAQG